MELYRELNSKVALKQKADEDLRKCRRELSSLRVEFQQAKKQLKEKHEYSTLAEEDVKRYLAENAKLQDKLKALQDSIASPSGDPRNSALSRLLHESPAPSHLRMSNLNMSYSAASPSTPALFIHREEKKAKVNALHLNMSNLRPQLSNPQEEEENTAQPKKETRKIDSLAIEREPGTLKFKRKKFDSNPSSGYYYDGFGGHSKPDIYPKGSSSLPHKATSKPLFKTKPVTIKTKGKTQTTTLDYFFME